MTDIKTILAEATDGALNEEVLSEIEKVFESKVNDRVEIHVEKALSDQDELYSEKLEQLIEKIDTDHTTKLERVVEALDADRANKLKLVIEKYEETLNEDASKFKSDLVETISNYLDVYLEETVPVNSIKEAVKNTKAVKVLESLRSHLAVDAALEKESIKEAVMDGHSQINEANEKLESIANENANLKGELERTKAQYLIEAKSSKLDDKAKKFVLAAFKGKDITFIKENFDYTVKLFKKQESDRLDVLKEEAYSKMDKVDVIYEDVNVNSEVIEEKASNPYLDELSKY